jgi:hypothetical protein
LRDEADVAGRDLRAPRRHRGGGDAAALKQPLRQLGRVRPRPSHRPPVTSAPRESLPADHGALAGSGHDAPAIAWRRAGIASACAARARYQWGTGPDGKRGDAGPRRCRHALGRGRTALICDRCRTPSLSQLRRLAAAALVARRRRRLADGARRGGVLHVRWAASRKP